MPAPIENLLSTISAAQTGRTAKTPSASFLPAMRQAADGRRAAADPAASCGSRDFRSHRRSLHRHLESLRDALVKQGKPLNRTGISEKHLPLLGRFLELSGFSPSQIRQCLARLQDRAAAGKLTMSGFFREAAALDPKKTSAARDGMIDSSAVPYLETALRRLDFTPKGISHALAAAKIGGGGIDSRRLLDKLAKAPAAGDSALPPVLRRAAAEAAVKDVLQLAEDRRLSTGNVQALVPSSSAVGGEVRGGKSGGRLDISPADPAADQFQAAVRSADRRKASAAPNPFASSAGERPENLQSRMTALPISGDVPVKAVQDAVKEILARLQADAGASDPDPGSAALARIRLMRTGAGPKSDSAGRLGSRSAAAAGAGHEGGAGSWQKADPGAGPAPAAARIESGAAFKSAPRGDLPDPGAPRAASATLEGLKHAEPHPPGSDSLQPPMPVFSKSASAAGGAVTAGQRTPTPPPGSAVPGHVIEQVGSQLSRAVAAGDRTVELRLKPPELGGVKVQLEIQDSALKLGVVVENRSVRDLLQSHLHELRDMLANQGIKVDRLDVDIQQQFGQSTAQSGGFSENRRQRAHGQTGRGPTPAEEPPAGSAASARHRLLDVTA